MRIVLLVALALSVSGAASANPCTNGSFEELAPGGFPIDWERVGRTVDVVHDVHTGQCALRLLRTPDTKESETGLNRAWKAHSGERGAMIDRLKGGIEFWYKALSAAEGTKLTVQAIPMNADPIEQTESRRAIFDVPKEHIGDGQWHQGRLKYDFTGDPMAKWVHFAARILGAAGEMLLDDFAYIESVGPLLRISRLRLDEDPEQPGRKASVVARLLNAGDVTIRDVRVALGAPAGLVAAPAEALVAALAPDEEANILWQLDGPRTKAGVLRLRATANETTTLASLEVAPRLVVESYGFATPIGIQGQPVNIECVLRNTGNAIVVRPVAEFITGCGLEAAETATRQAAEIPPGGSCLLRLSHRPTKSTVGASAGYQARITVRADNVEGELQQTAVFLVAPAAPLPPPSGRLRAVSTSRYAILENEHVRLAFRPMGHDCPAELAVRTHSGWQTIAWLRVPEGLSWRSAADASGMGWIAFPNVGLVREAEMGDRASLRFTWPAVGTRHAVTFSLAKGERAIAVSHEHAFGDDVGLEGLSGPSLHVVERDEAVFPGLEWLVGDEPSSSDLDIAHAHLHRDRYRVHPNMVTIPAAGIQSRHGTAGLVWDVHQKWDGTRDRPSVVFDSPNRRGGDRCHFVGLELPTVPEFVPAHTRAYAKIEPYPLKANQPVRLSYRIFADGEAKDALAAVDEWIRIYGLPEPAPLPRRSDTSDPSYESEIQFSMQAYLKSLWVPETKEWWTTKGGGPIMSKKGRPHSFVADLLLGALVSPDESVREQCRERAEEVAALLKTEPRLDAMRFPGRFDLAVANPARAAELLSTMGDDGAWRFDADQEGRGPFVGKDYHELGPDNAVEVGTCANKAFQVLRYARIAGDAEAYDRMQKTLRLMETFRVPRAAQVWEVPVHTPDLLAAADAADAYIEAYRFSGDERWLRDAVTWARRGIPFIYLWNPPDKPWLLGASIPVYGATWFTGSWFGRPVQWNGLRYATAILKLSEHDQSKDWRRLAELIIRSAILQQDPDGDNVALWPDNISAIDGKKCPWVFAPRQIIQNILLLNGRDEEPQTTILTRKPLFRADRRIHITATAKVSDAAWDGETLSFKAAYPQGEEGTVLITNVARPTKVLLDSKPVAERPDVEKGAEPGWRYDDANAYLSVRVAPPAGSTPTPVMLSEAKHLSGACRLMARETPVALRIEGAHYRHVQRLIEVVSRIDFSFDRSPEGWRAERDIADLVLRGGALCGKATGGDPYLVRSLVRASGDDYPAVLIRMRATAGPAAQFFWATAASPAFDEAKSLRFQAQPDGQWHDYRLDVGKHPQWAGQTITAVRLDPGNAPGEFAVDLIRGEGR